MNPSEEINKLSGFLLVNKPSGPTSHDIISRLRKITGIKRIGHAGTLDPFASGLLIIAAGREATREISRFVKLDKEYIATLCLGAVSDTYDRTGKISAISAVHSRPKDIPDIEEACKKFIGRQEQVPPMYSAKKVGGKKLYELARKGIEIERKAAQIEIYSISILGYNHPYLILEINCSSGTYIRSLADDIGKALGTGAYLDRLIRTRIGGYPLDLAVSLDGCTSDRLSARLLPIRLFLGE